MPDYEFNLGDMRGKKIYAKSSVQLFRPGKKKPFRKVERGGLIGKMTDWKVDTTNLWKNYDYTNPYKGLNKVKLLIFFEDKKGPYFMIFQQGGNQISFDAIKKQGVKTVDEQRQETKEKAEQSPFEGATSAAGDILKKYWPLIAAGLVTVILIKKA